MSHQITPNKPPRVSKRAAKVGGVTVLITAALLCLLVVFNLILFLLPAEWTMFDTSDSGITDISEKSKAFLKDMETDVTIFWLCENGEMNDTLGLLMTGYEKAGDRVDVVMVDPINNPSFTAKYTDAELSNYSLIIESELRHTVVDADDLYYYTNDFVDQELNGGNTYKLSKDEFTELYSAYGSYMSQYASYEFFQGEALITSALDYVTAPSLPHTYVLTGHGDTKLSDIMMAALGVYQVAPDELNLQAATAVPEDASCIILHDPQSDISPDEAELLKAYVKGGGSLVLVTNPSAASFENLASVTALFGLTAEEGMVVEPTENYYNKEKHNLIPLVNTNLPPLSSLYGMGYFFYSPVSHGISIPSTLPTGVSAAPLLATTDKAYRLSTDGEQTKLCDPKTHTVGAFAILSGASADGTVKDGKLIWFASSKAFTQDAAATSSGGNYYYFATLTRYVTDMYASPYANIEGVNTTTPVLENMTVNTALVLGVIFVIAIPMTLLISGLVIWLKRRNR